MVGTETSEGCRRADKAMVFIEGVNDRGSAALGLQQSSVGLNHKKLARIDMEDGGMLFSQAP